MRRVLTVAALLGVCVAAGDPGKLKVPDGCKALKGAKPTSGGWADRVVHEKTGIELVYVPAGSFTMGTMKGGSNSKPPHKVEFKQPFYMGKTEVTNGQYRRFVKASGYDGAKDADTTYDLYLRHFRGKSIMPTDDDHPVVWVSWKNARAFCKWAGVAVPSEAQWEYACRAGTTTEYSFGDKQADFVEYGWSLHDSKGTTHPVGKKKPNAWGLYDMHGNVWEWCEDTYVHNYQGAPTDGTARVEKKMTKALRGGCWSDATLIWAAGSAARHNSAPVNASNNVGFRVVLRVAG